MTILLIFATITIGSIIGLRLIPSYSNWDIPFILCSVISGIITVLMLIAIPIERESVRSSIQAMEATRKTFETARAKTDNIERFSRLDEVISWNKWLARKQYHNANMWDLYIPDEIENIKPIK